MPRQFTNAPDAAAAQRRNQLASQYASQFAALEGAGRTTAQGRQLTNEADLRRMGAELGRRQEEVGARGVPYRTDLRDYRDDRYDASQARMDQAFLGESYRDVLSGDAPSVAEMQQRRAQDAAIANQLAFAASARGGDVNRLAAARQAQQGLGTQLQQNTLGAALLRAREQEAARQGFASLAGQTRGQDIQAAGQSLAAQQQAADLALRQQAANDALVAAYLQGEVALAGQATGATTARTVAEAQAANRARELGLAERELEAAEFWAPIDRTVGAGLGLTTGLGRG